MACNKLLKHSNVFFSNSFSYRPIKWSNQYTFGERKVFFNRHFGTQCAYFTKLCLKASLHQKKQGVFSAFLNPVSFMSTSGGDEHFRMIVTNPGQDGTNVTEISNVSNLQSVVSSSDNSALVDSATELSISDVVSSLSSELPKIVEPTLESLGLAHWTPVGLVQMLLEYMHVSCHMPWWGAIVATTVVVRIITFPLLIKTQKNAIITANYMPQLQYLQARFGEARRTGNSLEASKYASEIMSFMKENNIKPLRNALFPLMQAPIFISFFMALRAMANAPVPSMMYGGIGWVSDLTIPDPYYVLPVAASATLYIVLKVGAESGVKLDNLKFAKYAIQAAPVIALPFIINFPSAILYYWVTSNFCTLITVSILKINPIRKYFNMPIRKPINPEFVMPKKGFVAGVKEAYEDQKILAAVEDRRRIDSIRFQKAGTGPIPRTYSYDPTKPRPSNIAAAAIQNRANVSPKE